MSFFVLIAGGHLYGQDGVAMYLMACSLLDRLDFDIPPDANTFGAVSGAEGRLYAPFGIGQPISAAPLLLVGRILKRIYDIDYLPSFFASFFNSLISALLIMAVYRFLGLIGITSRHRILVSVSLAMTTIIAPYSKYFYSEPYFALMLISSSLMSYRFKRSGRLLDIITAGSALGIAIYIRPIGILFTPAFLVYLLLILHRLSKSHSSLLKPILGFIIPVSTSVAVYLMYNYHRFGSLLDSGYHLLPDGSLRGFTQPLWYGLSVLLISPGKSIFIYSPLVVLVFFAFRSFHRRHKEESWHFIALYLLFMLTYGRWCRPEGGYTYGGRFLLPLVPYLAVHIAPWLSENLSSKRIAALFSVLLLAGFLVQLLGITVNFSEIIARNEAAYYNRAEGRYDLSFQPFSAHISSLLDKLFPLADNLRARDHHTIALTRTLDVVNYPLWSDCLDLWFLHLIKDKALKPPAFILLCLVAILFTVSAAKLITQMFRPAN